MSSEVRSDAIPESEHGESLANRGCVIALSVLWHQFLWSAVCWIFYYVIPEQKEILLDFEIEILPFVASVIRASDLVVIYYHLVPLFLVVLLAVDSAVMILLFKKPVRRTLWFLAMSALPFFSTMYGVIGFCIAFRMMAIQLAFESAQF